MEPWLLQVLACPKCHTKLAARTTPGAPALQCQNPDCALIYRIEDQIPVLLVDEATHP